MVNFESSVPQSCGVGASRGVRAWCLIAFLLLLSACAEESIILMEPDQQGGLTTSFSPPDMLTQSRAVVQDALQLRIEVNDEQFIVGVDADSNSGSVTIPAERGERLNIVVTWSELYDGLFLTLAQSTTSETIPVDADATFEIVIGTENYLTDFDDDGDEISNLDERNNDTDPRAANVLTNPIVQVPISLRANTPERLTDVNSDIDETLIAVGTVDTTTVPLNREGEIWTGETDKPANSDVLVNYSFFSTIRQNVVLARWEGRRNAGESGTTVEIASSEYDYEIDNDGDGIINLQEIIQGTNPEDKNEPGVVGPCDISNFEPGCDIDSDGDGTPDSVETETENQDGDSIPDYLESMNDDADEDGFNAELDSDESDPCVPSEEAEACDDSDPPQPPVIEPPEASPLSYELFEGQFESIPDFSFLTPTLSGTSTTFSLPPGNDATFYAIRFVGKLFVEQAGAYTFYTESDDGSRLFINDSLIVDNDGTHDLLEASGVLALPAGLHDIVLEYFQNDGPEALTVSWSSSDIAKQAIPENVLFAP